MPNIFLIYSRYLSLSPFKPQAFEILMSKSSIFPQKNLAPKGLRTVIRWTNEVEQDLKACFDLTDWSVFEAAATDLDELTETVTSYISFCEDMCIPTRTHLTYNNDKPWFTAKLRQLRQAKEDAYR